MYSTKFDPRILLAMRKFISEDETRYALNGILVEPSKTVTRLVATDGRRIIVLESDWQKADTAPFIIPATVLPFLTNQKGKEKSGLDYDGKNLEFGIPQWHELITVKTIAIDAKYPNWRDVVPSELPQKFAGNLRINHEFLRDISETLEILDPHRSLGIRYTSLSDADPLYISGPGFIIVQMPMKAEGRQS